MQAIALATRRRVPLAIAGVLLLAALAGAWIAHVHHSHHERALERATLVQHQHWAKPLDASFNLFQMAPGLYRSALPTPQNAATIDDLGVNTVISFIKDDDKLWAKNPSMALVSLPMHADRVTDDDMVQALRTLTAAQPKGPVLIHCKHGNNRTGIVAAMYRVVIQGWSRQAALDEMLGNGFGSEDDMAEATSYVQHADVRAISQALATGATCAHSFSLCSVKRHFGML